MGFTYLADFAYPTVCLKFTKKNYCTFTPFILESRRIPTLKKSNSVSPTAIFQKIAPVIIIESRGTLQCKHKKLFRSLN